MIASASPASTMARTIRTTSTCSAFAVFRFFYLVAFYIIFISRKNDIT
jgi:hypothetical protein